MPDGDARPQGHENAEVDAMLGQWRTPVAATVESSADLEELRARWNQLPATPVITENRFEGIDHSFASLDIRTLLGGEQSAGRFSVHSVVLPPGADLRAHYIDGTHSYLLVTGGEVELRIGDLEATVGQHSLGYAPPQTRQSLRNTSKAPATVMVVHHPAGSERAYEAAHQYWSDTGSTDAADYDPLFGPFGFHFDTHPLENDALTNHEQAPVEFALQDLGDMDRLRALFAERPGIPRLVRTSPEEYDAAAVGETRRKELLNGDVSAGTAMINMLSGAPGMNAPAHHQTDEEEFFFVTGGVLTLTCASQTRNISTGAFAFAPRFCTHGFSNQTQADARFVTLNSPAGHERSLAMLRQLAQEGASLDELAKAAVVGGWIIHDPPQLSQPRH